MRNIQFLNQHGSKYLNSLAYNQVVITYLIMFNKNLNLEEY